MYTNILKYGALISKQIFLFYDSAEHKYIYCNTDVSDYKIYLCLQSNPYLISDFLLKPSTQNDCRVAIPLFL